MFESEVVVIGGGIAGASTAFHLAQHGRRVTLLERGAIASESSGVNAGGIGALGWGNAPDLESHLTMGSLEIFRSLQLDLGYGIEFRQSGGLQAVQSAEEYEYARNRISALRSRGYTAELLTVGQARSIEPNLNPRLAGAIHFPLRAQADPSKATRALADAAQQHGADVVTGKAVIGITRTPDGTFIVDCSGDAFRAERLALAAGAWCGPLGEMLGVWIPVVPVRGQMWATEPLPPRVFHSISAAESYSYWAGNPEISPGQPPELTHVGDERVTRHLYGRQTQDGEVIFGGDRQALGYDRTVDADGIDVNIKHVVEILPFLGELPIKRSWSGLMPFSLDGKPIIGSIPQVDNLYVVSGLASSGFGRGPMAGKLLADYIHTGHRDRVLLESNPARCVTALG